jgi:hypothetical protein
VPIVPRKLVRLTHFTEFETKLRAGSIVDGARLQAVLDQLQTHPRHALIQWAKTGRFVDGLPLRFITSKPMDEVKPIIVLYTVNHDWTEVTLQDGHEQEDD